MNFPTKTSGLGNILPKNLYPLLPNNIKKFSGFLADVNVMKQENHHILLMFVSQVRIGNDHGQLI
jgi:hypothetical protein